MSMEHEDDNQVSSEQNQSPEEQVSVISVQQVQQQPDTEVKIYSLIFSELVLVACGEFSL